MTNHPSSRPVIVAGMHRSGTSMTASLLNALGVDVGRRLMAADVNNKKGYFEDWDFVDLQRAMFQAACPTNEPGWVEVGWTESETMNEAGLALFMEQAEQLVAKRSELPLWGWKDPRTSLLLPFWKSLLPDARYVLVYRHPWDVVDSLFRARHGVFVERPEFALRIWQHYNRQLLAFYRANPDVCLLVSTNAMRGELGHFSRLLVNKLGLPVAAEAEKLKTIIEEELMKDRSADDPIVALYREVLPESLSLLNELNAEADIPSVFSTPVIGVDKAVAAWHRSGTLLEADMGGEVERHRLDALSARAHAEAAEADLQALWTSTSWRLTAPLRAIAQRWRRPSVVDSH